MLTNPNRIRVAPNSELARVLDHVGDTPVLLELDGRLFQLIEVSSDDIWANYDPERVKAALRRSAGALWGVDRDQLLTDIRQERGQDSHGRPTDDDGVSG